MDNVERFDGVIDAMRKVKELIGGINPSWGSVYLAYNEYYEGYWVTDDSDDLSRTINQKWCDSGCDSSAESESDDWKVWEYKKAFTENDYPISFRKAKRSLIQASFPIMRVKRTVGCEYSVEFTIE